MTKLEIFNLALMHLGQPTIPTDVGNSTVLDALNAFYLTAVEEVLYVQDWNFARKRAELLSSDAPAFGFTHAHILPEDFMSVVYIGHESYQQPTVTDYAFEGHLILSNLPNIQMIYQARELDLSKWSNIAAQLLALKLADYVCVRLTASPALTSILRMRYDQLSNEARAVAANDTGGVRNNYKERVHMKSNVFRNARYGK